MAALHSNSVHVVAIGKLDRLARDLMVQEAAIAELAKHGFRLVSVCEPEFMSDDLPLAPRLPTDDGRLLGAGQEPDRPQAARCVAVEAGGDWTL